MIVSLNPDSTISFREKGRRQVFKVTLGHALNLAVLFDCESRYADALEVYNRKKKMGIYKRLRKPKKSQYPFSKFYFQAINPPSK